MYGYYGGVSGTNHYIPPILPGFEPQPPTKPTVTLSATPILVETQPIQTPLQPLPLVSHGLQSSLQI